MINAKINIKFMFFEKLSTTFQKRLMNKLVNRKLFLWNIVRISLNIANSHSSLNCNSFE